jgi:hypothetical protein
LPLSEQQLPLALSLLAESVGRQRARLLGERPGQRLQRGSTLSLLHDDVALLLAREAFRPRVGRARPIRFEFRFGPSGTGESPGPSFPLAQGAAVPLRGAIDRIDLTAEDRLEVIEYKTGAKRTRSGRITTVTANHPIVHLQSPLYLETAAQMLGHLPERAVLYHATAEHGFAEIEFTAGDLERARPGIDRLLRRALDCAHRGWFPSLPGPTCCQADIALACGAALTARFRRKQEDPEVLEHLALLRAADGDEARAPQEGSSA